MKKITNHPFFLLLIIGMIAVVYSACEKEDSSEKFPPNGTASCSDGVLNQGEYRTDCGGKCNPCVLFPSMSAVIDSFWVDDTLRGPGIWQADTMAAAEVNPGELYIVGADTSDSRFISFQHTSGLKRGTYYYEDIEGGSFSCDFTSAVIEIIAIDSIKHTVTGKFTFNCTGYFSGKNEKILDGNFVDLSYTPYP